METLKVRHITEDEMQDAKSDHKKESKQEEKTIEINADWKTWVIGFSLLIICALLAGAYMRDTGLQDGMNSIQQEKTNIKKQQSIIDSATISQAKSNSSIEQSKKVLSDKYHIIIQ